MMSTASRRSRSRPRTARAGARPSPHARPACSRCCRPTRTAWPSPQRRWRSGLLGQREAIFAHIGSLKDARFTGSKIRHHGDFHLGQVLIAKDDAYILDFEGEPRQSLEQRRSKAPPARDVAGFLRSIDYAASAAIERAPNITAEERPVFAARIRRLGRAPERRLLGLLQRGARRNERLAGRRGPGAAPARSLPAREGVLRDRIRADQPAGLDAYPARGDVRILAERGVVP